jgi:A-factor type gamma-butyrolactone 1'-reductase (1S-forming)
MKEETHSSLERTLAYQKKCVKVVPDAVRVFGRLDYAFNNAGISGPNRTLAEQSEADFDEVFQINVKSLFIIMQQEIHQMLHQGWGGSIVNMASVGSIWRLLEHPYTLPVNTLSSD